jgi:hypothetical protein
MIKLYKRIEGVLHYHEAWINGDTVLEHFGKCGDKGEVRRHDRDEDEEDDEAIERVLEPARDQGYEDLDEDDLVVLLVEYAVEGMGTEQDVDRRHAVEEKLNEALGWAGVGNVDGGSIGSGTMEVCCMVADAAIATRVIEAKLRDSEFANYSRIYEE